MGEGAGGLQVVVRRCPTQVGGAKNVAPPVKIYLNAFHRVVHNSIDLSFFAQSAFFRVLVSAAR